MKEESQLSTDTSKYASGTYAASPTDPLYVAEIPQLKFQSGKEPLETLEAQYWNWLWKMATKNINAFVDYLDDLYSELNNLLTEFGVTPSDLTVTQLANMFKSEYAVTFLGTKYLSLNGGTVAGDLHVKGDLTVDGTGQQIISTDLKVGANTITLRDGNPEAMVSDEVSGLVTENYDGLGTSNLLGVDYQGTARVGDIDVASRLLYSQDGVTFYEDEDMTIQATIGTGEVVRDTGNTTSGGVEIYEGTTYSNNNTQAIATREDNPVDGGFAQWDDATKKFVAVTPDAVPTFNSQNLVTSGGVFSQITANIPTGVILPYGGDIQRDSQNLPNFVTGKAPPDGWEYCDGTPVSRTDPKYAALYSVISIYYGSGDGTSTFNLPDMRESTAKGAGATGKINATGANPPSYHNTIALGAFQDDRAQTHKHTDGGHKHTVANQVYGNGFGGTFPFDTPYVSAGASAVGVNYGYATIGTQVQSGTSQIRAGETTEVKAVGVNWIIKL